ncbi:MAG: pyridoxal-phosphate dependent enzyme, partial [Planctomycetota bacterium]
LNEALNEALRDWSATFSTTHYLLGTAAGPHPYPTLVRELQRVIGDEARVQIQQVEGRIPDQVIACVGGGSNAIGMFTAFLDSSTQLIGVEAGGRHHRSGEHGATLAAGSEGILHGARTRVLQDKHGWVQETHSIAAGLDYPAVGPEHAHLHETGRAEYRTISDREALAAFHRLAREEGILPALESAHAVAEALKIARDLERPNTLLVCLSGRGEKDLATVLKNEEVSP